MTLPTDPAAQPRQDGTGTTWNFQLHPAFWFGMAMCDDQSAPNPAGTSVPSRAGPNVPCTPNSDTNIYTGTQFGQDHFLGQHPGAAFMELQFYAPGWASWAIGGNSCDGTRWCAAINIFGLSRNSNFPAGDPNRNNNADCLAKVGLEYANFAFVTKDGVSQAPANALDATAATFAPDLTKELLMNSGDTLRVRLFDTAAGFRAVIDDLTTGAHGSMTASVANGFGHIKFDPSATQCSVLHQPFHPMYSTSSEATRVPWAAHSYNIAFSDETGHFEYCNTTDGTIQGNCTVAGASEPNPGGTPDDDDNFCFNASQSLLVPINGCQGAFVLDADFDGVGYANNWAGTLANAAQDRALHSTPILFTSPLSNGANFDRVASETDLPAIEPACNVLTGAGCTNPPPGASFYPFYSTVNVANNQGGNSQGDFGCQWGEGGAFIPNATNTFGGSSTTAYGSLLFIPYVSGSRANTTGVVFAAENYRRVISSNPCRASENGGN
jgi:hypothetical protein